MLDYLADAAMRLREVLLGMYSHGAQRTPARELFMELFHIRAAYTRANCTDWCSPGDHYVGKMLKEQINNMTGIVMTTIGSNRMKRRPWSIVKGRQARIFGAMGICSVDQAH